MDLLEAAVPRALELAAEASIEFRKGLPKNYLGCIFHSTLILFPPPFHNIFSIDCEDMGISYQDNDDDEDRQAFIAHIQHFVFTFRSNILPSLACLPLTEYKYEGIVGSTV